MCNPEPQPNIILNVPDGTPDFRTGITLTIREPVYDTDKEKDDNEKEVNKDDNEKEVNKDDNEEEWNEMDEETKMIWKLAIT